MDKIDKLSIAAIRSTCIDMIHEANSGHPGMALGSAPILYTLFTRHLNIDPYDPKWINRDRFVLSAGHASSLLYTILHLCDYDIQLDDLKKFRKLGSITPGHPEITVTPGIDATSGPLGQGIAQAVGMAVAEKHLHSLPKYENYIDHYTYCLCGDGCLEEGISQEAISYAGTYKLNKLILIYDNNDVTLDGKLNLSSNDNVKMRFEASNWQVLNVEDGNDIDSIDKAIETAKKSEDKPTLIIVKTVIGYGSELQGTNKVHGSPLKDDDILKTKQFYEYNYPPFTIPDKVYKNFKEKVIKRGRLEHSNWVIRNEKLTEFSDYETIEQQFSKNYINLTNESNKVEFDENKPQATRKSSEQALNYYANYVNNLIGGSADVAASVLTTIKNVPFYSPDNASGTNMNFGIREFLMGSIANGICLHGGLKPYVGCFLVFADYMKPAIRMSAISELPVIYVFSHDSIAVGEDGPTHQPIEQLAMLRSIPNVNVIRPADERETYAAYKIALNSAKTPTCIITTRQNLPLLENSAYDGVEKGAYIVSKEQKKVDYAIIATGSEVSLAIEVQKLLLEKGIDTRIISAPSLYLLEQNDNKYIDDLFGAPYEKRIFIEMLSSYGLHKYAKNVVSIDTFGMSGNAKDIFDHFGFTPEKVINKILNFNK